MLRTHALCCLNFNSLRILNFLFTTRPSLKPCIWTVLRIRNYNRVLLLNEGDNFGLFVAKNFIVICNKVVNRPVPTNLLLCKLCFSILLKFLDFKNGLSYSLPYSRTSTSISPNALINVVMIKFINCTLIEAIKSNIEKRKAIIYPVNI